jgi:hypothetical protein
MANGEGVLGCAGMIQLRKAVQKPERIATGSSHSMKWVEQLNACAECSNLSII